MSCFTIPKPSYIDLGCFHHCGIITFPFKAIESGVYYLVYNWKGIDQYIESYVNEGENFSFEAVYINECFDGCVKILDQSGNKVSTPIFQTKAKFGGISIGDSICFDTFKIKIQIAHINKKTLNIKDLNFAIVTGKKVGQIKLSELLCNTIRD